MRSRLSTCPYLRWAKYHSAEAEINLTMSAVPPLDWEELGFDPRRLELNSYTAYGPEEVLDGVATRWGRSGDEVFLASSTTHAHFCFAVSAVAPGERVLFECPGYFPLIDQMSLMDVEPIRFERSAEEGFALPRERIEILLQQTGAGLILLTNLHNPSGTALTEEEMTFLVDLCDRTGVEIICDEIYRPFLDPDPGPLYLRHPNIISVWGLNKVHGLPQIRIGWGMATSQRVELARRILDATTVHNSCLSDQVASFAVGEMPRLEDRARAIARAGWDVLAPWLESSPFRFHPPSGGLTAFPGIPDGLFEDADELRSALLEVGVGITPGTFFETPSHFRVGVALDPELIREATRRIDGVIAARS